MSQQKLTPREKQFLQETLNADSKISSIRLREGEYQYSLAKTIASFQLELTFPNVKDIIERQFGREQINDIQFVRKIQTILKKMEKSNIVTILPKNKPWDLQRYGLLSFKFQDADRNVVVFATDEQIRFTREAFQSVPSQGILRPLNTRFYLLLAILIASYVAIVWDLTQPIINPVIFIPALSIAAAGSLILGKMLSRE